MVNQTVLRWKSRFAFTRIHCNQFPGLFLFSPKNPANCEFLAWLWTSSFGIEGWEFATENCYKDTWTKTLKGSFLSKSAESCLGPGSLAWEGVRALLGSCGCGPVMSGCVYWSNSIARGLGEDMWKHMKTRLDVLTICRSDFSSRRHRYARRFASGSRWTERWKANWGRDIIQFAGVWLKAVLHYKWLLQVESNLVATAWYNLQSLKHASTRQESQSNARSAHTNIRIIRAENIMGRIALVRLEFALQKYLKYASANHLRNTWSCSIVG